ncbi:hypothetical protein KIN20_018315 [Parelaphostrongylus tenuis]|uniref:Uncharacterized protein n=1 Tax=Parelaphostrongylus tenuis TaxID=148309 RepID=A0AAD5MJ98_PARTN|nr:hypothetical protein KIN20_018315 [Parelaphostrongylus tenuis]
MRVKATSPTHHSSNIHSYIVFHYLTIVWYNIPPATREGEVVEKPIITLLLSTATLHIPTLRRLRNVVDTLEEQGRRAGLFPAVISGILSQLTVNTSYNPLQCAKVQVNSVVSPPSEVMGGGCFIIGNTVTSICTKMPAEMCMYMGNFDNIVPVPSTHTTISGTVSTTNIIMSNWSTQMWRSVMNRAARSLASGPFGSHFFGAFVTVGS